MDVRRYARLPAGLLPPVSGAGRRWCENDPWTGLAGAGVPPEGLEHAVAAYAFIDPEGGDVDGPMRFRYHHRPSQTMTLLGTFDGWGTGEEVAFLADVPDQDGRNPYVEVWLPLATSYPADLLRTHPIEVWIGSTKLAGRWLPRQWQGRAGETDLTADNAVSAPMGIVAAGHPWDAPFNPAAK
jgi:hypothetical protein